jgi:hypothetical protein
VDLVVEMAVYNPFDFFLEPEAEKFPFKYDSCCRSWRPTWRPNPDAAGQGLPGQDRPHRTAHASTSWWGLNQHGAQRHQVPDPHGARRADAGGDAETGRAPAAIRLAAGAAAAPLRPGRALCVGLPDPADVPTSRRWTAPAAPRSTSPTCTPGARSTARRRLDRAGRHLGPAGRRRPHPAGLHAPAVGRRADRRRRRQGRGRVRPRHEGHRIYESPRVTKPYTEEQWAMVMALGARSMPSCSRRRAPDHGRRADLRGRGDRDAPSGTPTRWARPSAASPPSWCTSCAPNTARAAFALRPGQVVPRRTAAALGTVIYWRADGQPVWRNPALFADERDATTTPAKTPALHAHAGAQAGLTDQYIQPGYEDSWYYLWRERRLPVNVDPFDSRLDDEMERAAAPRVQQKLDTRGRLCACPSRSQPSRRGPRLPARAGAPALVRARRAHVPDAGRLADGPAPAAGLAALGQQGRLSRT